MPIAHPSLADGVVTLRAHTLDDVDDLIVMGNDPSTVDATTVPVPYERSHAVEWVTQVAPAGHRDGTAYRWAIEALDGDTPRFAGNLDIRLGEPPDIGYALAPWARGKGVMTRAVRLAARWAFDALDLPILHWSAHAGNFPSWRVAHACGFTFHGAIPKSIGQRGALRDGWFATLEPDADLTTPRTTWWPVPVLENARVRLRPLADADMPRIAEACGDERTRYWLSTLPHPYTEDHACTFLRERRLLASLGKKVSWAVVDPADDGRLLANISIFGLDDTFTHLSGEVGYWAHPEARGRGVVTAGVELAIAHAFTPVEKGGLGRRRLRLSASWGNAASRHVAERCGFTLTGHTHQDAVVGFGEDAFADDGADYELLAD